MRFVPKQNFCMKIWWKKDFIILARKSFIEMKYYLFLLIFVYDMQYTVQFMVHIKIVNKYFTKLFSSLETNRNYFHYF